MTNSNIEKTILVTGGAGYIGSAAVEALVTDGYKVVVFDNLDTGQKDKVHPEATLVVGDITNLSGLEAVFISHQFDAVVHFAGKKSVEESQRDPALYFKNNVIGTLNILTCMDKYQVSKIVFSSTAAVYEAMDKPDFTFTEESPVSPASVYGQSKLMSETLIREFHNTNKISEYVILRYFNVAGDCGLQYREDTAQNVFPIIARAIEQQKTFYIYGNDYGTKDGTGVRDYIHLADLVDAHLRALTNNVSGIFNIGTNIGYSVYDLVNTFESVTGQKIPVEIQPRRSGDIGTVVADATKAQQLLGWRPTRCLNDMVESAAVVYVL